MRIRKSISKLPVLFVCFGAGATSAGAQNDATLVETVDAISTLYENQSYCGSRDGGFYKGFSYVGLKYQFENKIGAYFSYLSVEKKGSGVIEVRFNPADIEKYTYWFDDGVFGMVGHCRGGHACANHNYPSASKFFSNKSTAPIMFCDKSIRDRVWRALTHVAKFYKPTLDLKF
jgi:hypothetical protein